MKKLSFLILVLSLFFYCGPKEGKVERIMVDGVAHIMNPEKPIKGEVQLDIKKTLEINPYQYEEVGIKMLFFARDTDGEVILFDPNKSEAHRFNSRGEYLGSLFRKGEGPGEFPDFIGLNIFFMNNQIWASGAMKLAKYDKNGQFLYERKLGYSPRIIVDDNRFFIRRTDRNKEGVLTKISLVNLSSDKESKSSIVDFFQAENLGPVIRKGNRSFSESWATPYIKYAYDRKSEKFCVALNTEYKIYVKNLKGETSYIIEKRYKNVKVGLKDKKKLLPWALRDESSKWMLSAYPDTLVAFKELKALPNGYLAVYRVSGPGTFEIDVFDPEGRYVYVMRHPEGVSLERIKFYNFGFAIKETKEDGLEFYAEYKIKNLPDIFKN
jgi:hypothetical protein